MTDLRVYETMFIIDPEVEEEEREGIVEKVKSIIQERLQGEIENLDRWGIRKLAYEINHRSEGDYTVVIFRANPDNLMKLESFFRVTPQVIRWQTFRREDIEKKKSSAPQKDQSKEQ